MTTKKIVDLFTYALLASGVVGMFIVPLWSYGFFYMGVVNILLVSSLTHPPT